MDTKELDKIIEDIFTNILKEIGYIQSEYVYQNAFAIELCKRNIINKQEFAIPVGMNGEYLGEKKIDIAIFYKDENNEDQKYLLELKSKPHYKGHNRQLFGYSLTTQSKGQVLVNFFEGWAEYQHRNNLRFNMSYSDGNSVVKSRLTHIQEEVLNALKTEEEFNKQVNPYKYFVSRNDLGDSVAIKDMKTDTVTKTLQALTKKGFLKYERDVGYQSTRRHLRSKIKPQFNFLNWNKGD